MHRPASATVFGILCLGFAGLGLVGVVQNLAFDADAFTYRSPGMPESKLMRFLAEDPGVRRMKIIGAVFGVPTTAMLAAVGIGLLKLKEWGRKLAIAYAIVIIAWTPISSVLTYRLMIKPMGELAEDGSPGDVIAARMMQGMVFCLPQLGLAFPVAMLMFMRRQIMKDACAGRWKPPWLVLQEQNAAAWATSQWQSQAPWNQPSPGPPQQPN